MTDNLRTKIAAVICGMDALHAKQWSLDVADAVIRELKMEREHWQYGDGHTMGVRYRYVTEWQEESNG